MVVYLYFIIRKLKNEWISQYQFIDIQMKISVLQVISACTIIKKTKLDVIDHHTVSLTLSSPAKLQPVIFLQSIDGHFDVIFERKIILRINFLQNSSIQSHFHLTRFKTNLNSCSSIES